MSYREQAASLLPSHSSKSTTGSRGGILQSLKSLLARRLIQLLLIAVSLIIVILALTGGVTQPSRLRLPSSAASKLSSTSPRPIGHIGPSWPQDGWDGIRNIFAFGDSYSDTAFDPSGDQPSLANPFGNPTWALDLAAGSNWLHFLALSYNTTEQSTFSLLPNSHPDEDGGQRGLRVFSHAIAGSTVDAKVVAPYHNTERATLVSQIYESFVPAYASADTHAHWSPQDTLFTFWLGMNDILIPSTHLQHPVIPQILASYMRQLSFLFTSVGARNFLILDIPPIWEAHKSSPHAAFEVAQISNFNIQLNESVQHFRDLHPEAKVFFFAASELWAEVLEVPGEYEATEQLARLDGPCDAYSARETTLVPDFIDVHRCGVGVEQYFWRDTLHATYPVHNLTAQLVVEECFGEEGPVGYCF